MTTSFLTAQALHKAGKLTEAEAHYRRLLSVEPGNDLALQYLGLICLQTQRLDEAYALVSQALAIREDDNRQFHLAMVCLASHRLTQAIALLERVLQGSPQHARACFYLANAWRSQGDKPRAIAHYRRFTQLAPTDPAGWKNLGSCLFTTGQLTEAEAALRHAQTLAPNHRETLNALSLLLEHQKAYDDALTLSLSAGDLPAICRLKHKNVRWLSLEHDETRLWEQIRQGNITNAEPLGLAYYPGLTRQLHRDAARRFAETLWPALLTVPLTRPALPPNPRLKIGYLSADFVDHATLRLLVGVLETHDTSRYDTHLYCYSPKRTDSYTLRLTQSGLPLHNLRELDDRQAAEKIAADGVDILIDLKGYTADARPGITALRPAPIIINWLGYPGSMGHPALADFIIGDPWVTPLSHASDYSETLALMPHCYQPNDDKRMLPAAVRRSDVGLPEDVIVLCSFNQTVKYGPALFTLWSKVMKTVPDSVLWLLEDTDDQIAARLRHEMVARGIAGERIIFAPFVSQAQHMARLQLADIALDTFPYNSHTTASDALWAGVPLVTLSGETFASRVARGLLHAAHLPELAVDSEEDWLALTIRLARDSALRHHYRERVIAARQHAPLFDTLRFTRNLERLYEAVHTQRTLAKHERTPVVIKDNNSSNNRGAQ